MPDVGDVIDDKYKITRLLGEGAMGSVFLATHTRIRFKKVAIKFLRYEHASNSEVLVRFEREAEAASAINHPGIIGIHDMGLDEAGTPYLVMDFLNGQSLKELLQDLAQQGRQQLPIDFTCYLACKVLSALSAAHRAGIIHRDLKPDNIFLVESGNSWPDIRLLDFGIASFKNPDGEITSLTKTGTILGTPYYMSPEQTRGSKDLDHRTDIFSVGTILYKCLTAEYPFKGANKYDLLIRICTSDFPEPSLYRPDLPPQIAASLKRALQKKPDQRQSTAAEMFDELRPFAGNSHSILAPKGEASPAASQSFATGQGENQTPSGTQQAPMTSVQSDESPLPPTMFSQSNLPLSEPMSVLTQSALNSQKPARHKLTWLKPAILGGLCLMTLFVVGVFIVALSDDRETSTPQPRVTSQLPAETALTAPQIETIIASVMSAPTPTPTPDTEEPNRWITINPISSPVTLGLPTALKSPTLSGFRAARGVKSPSYSFAIQQHEVTWAELRPWLEDNTEHHFAAPTWLPAGNTDQYPVTAIPWSVAQAYCKNLRAALPTEEEWEYAARGPELRPYPWGWQPIDITRNHVYRPEHPLSKVMTNEQDVTSDDPNQAIYDLLGNAREWTADVYRLDSPATSAEEAWTRAEGRTYRTVRGMPPAEKRPNSLHPYGTAARDALCATGPCAETVEDREFLTKLMSHVGFRCVRRSD